MDVKKLPALFILNDVDKKTQYFISIITVSAVAAICLVLNDYVGAEVVAFILLLTLSVIAMLFDIMPVMLSALLSALIWDYYFLAPTFSWSIGTTEDRVMLSMYFVIALLNAVLTYKIRQFEKVARQEEEKANILKLYKTLLNSLSHELRTPIATITGATDNLLTNGKGLTAGDKQNLLSEISIASLRLNQQVENLLNMSRLESGFIQVKKDWCDLNELVNGVIKTLDEQLGNDLVLIKIDDTLPLYKLDYGLMEQIVYNLINNAARYTPDGSLITVSAYRDGEELVIMVEDNGNGFPEEEISKVFEKFYRLNNTRLGGTGLGLSIVKGFVEAHNGTINLRNNDDGGASFTIKIPAEHMLLKTVEK